MCCIETQHYIEAPIIPEPTREAKQDFSFPQ